VEILFRNEADRLMYNDSKSLVRKHNVQRAKQIRRRLDDLRAALTLEAMRNLPGRCHELKGDRATQLSLDLDGPYRLILCPAHDPIPRKADGGLDWNLVTAVRIIEVTDTHE
jgi:proteic killer suppression protein